MLVKNKQNDIVWSVTEKHGGRLLRSGDFEEVEQEAPKPKRAVKSQNTETEK